MAYELPPLPYAHEALEPIVSKETMTYHHDKHHQAYTDNLNKALDANPDLAGKSLEQIFAEISSAPAAVRNNGGGFWNHIFFWDCMKQGGSAPSGKLAKAIDEQFGTLEMLKDQFNNKGAGQFGSGWAWLIVNEAGKLQVISTANQDNPLMDVVETRGVPILTNDVWEHAYYLTYRNDRGGYLKAWWDVVDWDIANKRYEAALAG
ncbi:superoxide dismutase [Sandaracinobacter sp. RS1-74]|uniref:superoxide dismutase n=1 Tax=Sandaracinobacteroides sayramensis TaxID=2913411 RepID=UPI001EDB4511|nr:superoxide dismutase [Sandaracinobacteroides sayramensis]MCG2842122.1 superoxide dismutase [Sandaracinobacteroides sayramensis]